MVNTIEIGGKVRGVRAGEARRRRLPVIFANVGVSGGNNSIEDDRAKIARALAAKADVISELSLVDDIADVQREADGRHRRPVCHGERVRSLYPRGQA